MNTETDWNERAARASGRDITANRHKGSAMSVRAFEKIKRDLPFQRREVLEAITEAGEYGITCRELCDRRGCGMNEISGRFTELRAAGLIEIDCTRQNCSVYRLAVDLLCSKCNGNGEVASLYGAPRTCNLCQDR